MTGRQRNFSTPTTRIKKIIIKQTKVGATFKNSLRIRVTFFSKNYPSRKQPRFQRLLSRFLNKKATGAGNEVVALHVCVGNLMIHKERTRKIAELKKNGWQNCIEKYAKIFT